MAAGDLGPLGGEGAIVEADETYYGKRDGPVEPSVYRRGRPYTKAVPAKKLIEKPKQP